MNNETELLRRYIQFITEIASDDPLRGFPTRKKISHVIKPETEQLKDEAIKNLEKIISYLESTKELDSITINKLLLGVNQIEKNLSQRTR